MEPRGEAPVPLGVQRLSARREECRMTKSTAQPAKKPKKMTQAELRRFVSRRTGPRELEELLAENDDLKHLRVMQRGESLTLVSGSDADEVVHAKFTALGAGAWGLSF